MQGAADSGLTAAAALEWTRQQQPAVETIAPHWIDELQGLAHGAGIHFDEALALQLRPGAGGLPEGCTSFAAVGSATTDRQTICGQNRDLGEPYLHRMFLAAFRPTHGPHILMHCVPGEIGGVGLNFKGVHRTNLYLDSVARIRRLAAEENNPIEVNITNHAEMGRIFERAEQLASREPSDPHPFVDPRGFLDWLAELQRNAEHKLTVERELAGE